jgi:hypothetical protein
MPRGRDCDLSHLGYRCPSQSPCPGFFELALELLYEPGNPRAVILMVRRLVVQIKSVIKSKSEGRRGFETGILPGGATCGHACWRATKLYERAPTPAPESVKDGPHVTLTVSPTVLTDAPPIQIFCCRNSNRTAA